MLLKNRRFVSGHDFSRAVVVHNFGGVSRCYDFVFAKRLPLGFRRVVTCKSAECQRIAQLIDWWDAVLPFSSGLS